MHDLETHVKAVQAGTEKFDGEDFLTRLYSFSDVLYEHLAEVCLCYSNFNFLSTDLLVCFQEIPTVEASILRKHFTDQEMKAIDDAFIWRAIKNTTFNTTIPVLLVCANPATPWYV